MGIHLVRQSTTGYPGVRRPERLAAPGSSAEHGRPAHIARLQLEVDERERQMDQIVRSDDLDRSRAEALREEILDAWPDGDHPPLRHHEQPAVAPASGPDTMGAGKGSTFGSPIEVDDGVSLGR